MIIQHDTPVACHSDKVRLRCDRHQSSIAALRLQGTSSVSHATVSECTCGDSQTVSAQEQTAVGSRNEGRSKLSCKRNVSG